MFTDIISTISGFGYLFSWLPSPLDVICSSLIGLVLIITVVKAVAAIIGVFT